MALIHLDSTPPFSSRRTPLQLEPSIKTAFDYQLQRNNPKTQCNMCTGFGESIWSRPRSGGPGRSEEPCRRERRVRERRRPSGPTAGSRGTSATGSRGCSVATAAAGGWPTSSAGRCPRSSERSTGTASTAACNGCKRKRAYGCSRKPRVFYDAGLALRATDAESSGASPA